MKSETEFLALVKKKQLAKRTFTEDRKATLQNAYAEPFPVVYLRKNTVKVDW